MVKQSIWQSIWRNAPGGSEEGAAGWISVSKSKLRLFQGSNQSRLNYCRFGSFYLSYNFCLRRLLLFYLLLGFGRHGYCITHWENPLTGGVKFLEK